MKYLLSIFLSCIYSFTLVSQSIKLNQVGFYPEAKKVAVVANQGLGSFELISLDGSVVYYTGVLSESRNWSHSEENVRIADFSDFTVPGNYKVRINGVSSYSFSIADNVNLPVLKATLKAYYYNRASTSIPATYGGVYARGAGHPDDVVYVHQSAASTERPAGTIISAPKGWYDAGDFGKYVVNSGISTYTLLAAYEHFPEYYAGLELNIPESGNTVPDILEEAKWNLDWMLDMQDPNDGGVYHKLTTKGFTGIVMPANAGGNRYVVQKSTSATLDFAAVMAQASRIFKEFESEFPGYSQMCLDAAVDAWTWARANPSQYYNQPSDIFTGGYGDRNVNDEFDWAATELYITTKDDSYYSATNLIYQSRGVPGWQFVSPLGWISLAHHKDDLTDIADLNRIDNGILVKADQLLAEYNSSAYRIPMGEGYDFVWGSNGVAGNQSMILVSAYKLTGNEAYLDAATANMDYLLGRNAIGYSFVTGHGAFTPKNIHHRASAADGIAEPIPGFVAGGPQAGQEDGCSGYIGDLDATSYVDSWCSYSTNEITINWNAPMVYVTGALEYYAGQSNSAPVIISHPNGVLLQEGASTELTVTASGKKPMAYQWQKNGVDISAASSATLSLTDYQEQDTGSYRVIVSNELGKDTSDVAVMSILKQAPFAGVPIQLPGRLEVEDYDLGGQNLGYYDTDFGNNGGEYRTEDVDIEECSEGGYNIGYLEPTEWLEYTVDVSSAGYYDFNLRLASDREGSELRIEFNDQIIIPSIKIGDTGGWQSWVTDEYWNINLPEGESVVKIYVIQGPVNVNYIDVSTSPLDCIGEPRGLAIMDSCGICSGGNTNVVFNSTCNQDCNGKWNGTATEDDCGVCSGGNTGIIPNSTCAQDCALEWGGSAYLDDCNVCVGGSTGAVPCTEDCAGITGGTAYFDNCGNCVSGTTEYEPCTQDCYGEWGGTATKDSCGICSGGNTGKIPNEFCEQDCSGAWGGSAIRDSCNNCVEGNTGIPFNESCAKDCKGIWGGEAYVDNCGVCINEVLGNMPCEQDCNLDWGGSASIDDCGTCSGGATGVLVNDCLTSINGANAVVLKVSPNPSKSGFTLKTSQPGTFNLIDLSGRILAVYGIETTLLFGEELAPGMYILQFESEGYSQVVKVVKR